MISTIGLPASRHQAEQWSLVLRAADIPSVIEFEKRSWVIKVSPLHEKQALKEIAAFMEENKIPKHHIVPFVMTEEESVDIDSMVAAMQLVIASVHIYLLTYLGKKKV